MDSSSDRVTRRGFLNTTAGLAAAAMAPAVMEGQAEAQAQPTTGSRPAGMPRKMIGIQIPAVSFVDEGVDEVLDILQERGQVNTLFLATFTYDGGTGGRQVRGRPFPDHGPQQYDNFHGGNYATPHAQFYKDTVLKDTKAPDHGDTDILELVLPKTKKRGMKVFAWNYNIFRRDIPNVQQIEEVDLQGRRVATCCAYNPDYRNFIIGLTKDHCTSYDIDGVLWGSEHQGPLNNIITARGWSGSGTTACFCDFHKKAARDRGIDVDRAVEGYQKLDLLINRARSGAKAVDGYFVEFWRLLLDYPELLAWEKLWTDGKHSIYADIYNTAKSVRKELQVGFHIWQEASFSPFHRAEQTYDRLCKYADFIKPVVYNNAAGPRYAKHINTLATALFRDVPAPELVTLNNHLMNYDEGSIADLPTKGLSADYVFRETQRTIADLPAACQVYPGIDIDIPTAMTEKQTTPEDVDAATAAAFKAGAQGVIFSRKYSEMRLANLSGGGRAVKALATRG